MRSGYPALGLTRRGRASRSGYAVGFCYGLLTTSTGDTTLATVEQVKAFAQGGSARIQR